MFKKRKFKNKRSLEKKKEIKNKVRITLILLILFRILTFVPVPFVKTEVWSEISQYSFMTFIDVFAGGINSLTFMAIGVSAYITSSIVLQMVGFVYQPLGDLSKTPNGQKVIKRYTILLSIMIAGMSSGVILFSLENQNEILSSTEWYAYATIVAVHIVGTLLSIFIGETIDDKGYGSGISMLIAVNIVSALPHSIRDMITRYLNNLLTVKMLGLGILLVILVLIFVVIVETSQRELYIRYSKAEMRNQQGATAGPNIIPDTFPIKFNLNGVIPLILATAFIQLFVMVATFASTKLNVSWLLTAVSFLHSGDNVVYFLTVSTLIFLSSFMYSFMAFDAREISENLQKNGGVIVDVKPGPDTTGFLRKINFNLTFWSSLFLALISFIPMLLFAEIGFRGIAATSMMIVIGVALELWNDYSNDKKILR